MTTDRSETSRGPVWGLWMSLCMGLSVGLLLSACNPAAPSSGTTDVPVKSAASPERDAFEAEFDALTTRTRARTEEAGDARSLRDEWVAMMARAEALGDAEFISIAAAQLANMDYSEGHLEAALKRTERAIAYARMVLPDRPHAVASTYITMVATRGVILSQLGRAEEAIADQRSALSDMNRLLPTEDFPFPDVMDAAEREHRLEDIFMAKSNLEFGLSQSLMRNGDFDEAVTLQRQSLATRKAGLPVEHAGIVQSQYALANTLMKAGDMKASLEEARGAVARADRYLSEDNTTYPRTLEMLGIILGRSGRTSEAVRVLDRALRLKGQAEGRDNLYFAYGLHNLGTIKRDLGDYAPALALLSEAEAGFVKYQGATSPMGATARAYRGSIRYALGDQIAAQLDLQVAKARLSADDDTMRLTMALLADMGIAEDELGRPDDDSVISAHVRAVAARLDGAPDAPALIDRMLRSDTLLQSGRLDFAHRLAAEEALRSAHMAGDEMALLEAVALLLNTEASVAAARAQMGALDDIDPATLRQWQSLHRDLRRLDRDRLAAIAAGNSLDDIVTAEAAVQSELAALQAMHGLNAGDTISFATSVPALQAQLGQDEALVAMIPALSRHFTLIVDEQGSALFEHDAPRAVIARHVTEARDAVLTASGPEQTAALQQAGQALLPDAVMDRLGSKTRLRVVSAGAPSTIPLSALRLANGDWLGDRFALRHQARLMPAGAAMKVTQSETGLNRFVGVAPPEALQAESGAGRILAYRDNVDLALPNARSELEAMAARFDQAVILSGETAREARLKSGLLSDADVIAFATHGLKAGERGDSSDAALLVEAGPDEDGYLETAEIAALELSAKLVILSACDTAAPGDGSGNGYSGLAAGFLEAGAQGLLVSHWPVRDDAAARLTTRLIELSRDHDLDMALKLAMADMRTSDLPGANDPAIWAPFVLYTP